MVEMHFVTYLEIVLIIVILVMKIVMEVLQMVVSVAQHQAIAVVDQETIPDTTAAVSVMEQLVVLVEILVVPLKTVVPQVIVPVEVV